ncbi:MAG: response regulator, partial [Magnetococcus sp. DMHC-8]
LMAILLGMVLAWRISRGISRPVVAMTRALSDLAQGRVVDEIPGRGRRDEIGSMAQAADVFKQKADALENASRYKSEFLANMSHELRTPLNSLLILSRLLASNREGNLSDDQVDSAQIIHDSGSDLLAMINDILDLSKVEAGRMDVVAESRDVDRFLEGVERQFRHLVTLRGLTLRIVVEHRAPRALVTDWVKVEQILRNLLSNACKFTETGGITVRFGAPDRRVIFGNRALEEPSVVVFTVTDTGIDIPQDKQALIFEAFRQVDGTTSRRYGGTGLGLTISRQLAQLLGGELQVESRVGEGSRFTLCLPALFPWPDKVAGAHVLSDAPMSEQPSVDFAAPHVTVLVVDDDVRNCQAIDKLLHGRVRRVMTAGQGAEALRLLAADQAIDLVLMDIMMPVMDGYQAIQAIRQQQRFVHLPVIALTAKAMPGDRQRCLEAGATAYLSKPVRIEQLFATMRALLELPSTAAPVRAVAPAPAGPTGLAAPLPVVPLCSNGRPLTVLVVDDDLRAAFALARELQTRVAHVLLAADGARALGELAAHPEVDVILLDLCMPHLDGYETLRAIRADDRFRHVALLVLTALATPGDAEKCLAAGADAYLTKPAAMETIWSRLEEVLAVRAARGEKEPTT